MNMKQDEQIKDFSHFQGDLSWVPKFTVGFFWLKI